MPIDQSRLLKLIEIAEAYKGRLEDLKSLSGQLWRDQAKSWKDKWEALAAMTDTVPVNPHQEFMLYDERSRYNRTAKANAAKKEHMRKLRGRSFEQFKSGIGYRPTLAERNLFGREEIDYSTPSEAGLAVMAEIEAIKAGKAKPKREEFTIPDSRSAAERERSRAQAEAQEAADRIRDAEIEPNVDDLFSDGPGMGPDDLEL